MARRITILLLTGLVASSVLVLLVVGVFIHHDTMKEAGERGRLNALLGARMTQEVLEKAVHDGLLDVRSVFEARYQPIEGNGPSRYRTEYSRHLDRVLPGFLSAFQATGTVHVAYVVSRDGYVPVHTDPGLGKTRVAERPAAPASEGAAPGPVVRVAPDGCRHFEYASPILILGQFWGEFRVGIPSELVWGEVGRQVAVSAVGTLLSSGLVAVMIYLVLRRGLRPLRTLSTATARMAGGDLGVRAGAAGAGELADLSRTFNAMADAIQSRDQALRDANSQLEARVAQRTDELRRAEEEAQSLRMQMEFILGASKTGLDIIDSEFNVRYIDPEWRKVYGDPTGRKCYDYFMGRIEPCPGCGLTKALQDKAIAVTEEVLPKENSRPIQVTTIPFQNQQGEWLVAEVNVDITDRKRAQRRVEHLNALRGDLLGAGTLDEKFRRITDAVVQGFDADFARIWVIRPGDRCDSGCVHARATEGPHVCRHRDRCLHLVASSGRYTHIDGEVHRRVPFGCYKIGIVASGQDRKFLTNDASQDPRVHNRQWAAELGLVSFVGYRLLSPRGEPIGVLALFSRHAIDAEEDALLEGVADTAGQVIQSARAEEALHHAKEEAQREAAKLSAMICGMEEGVVFANADNVIVEINEYLCGFLGRRREEILGKRIEDLHHGKVLGNVLEQVRRFREGRDRTPFVLQRPLGRAEVILRMQPVYREGVYDGVLLNIIDVTELVRARQQAEAANAAKGEFLANVSHEIRTPMTAIMGFADLLAESLDCSHTCPEDDRCPTCSENCEHVRTIRDNGRHLLEILNDILDLSKIEAGKMAIEPAPCNLMSVLADVASIMRVKARDRGVDLLVESETDLPESILTDAARLRQGLVNLVGNAVKFTDSGSVRIVTALVPRWRDDRPAVRIRVVDTGIGIAQEALPRLFQPFAQADSSTSRTYGGTGLGLAITRRIAEKLGGELTVQSVLGKGSTFTLTIPTGPLEGVPMRPSPAEAVRQGPTPPAVFLSPRSLAGVRVLLAEDGPDNQRLIRTLLQKAGAEVEIAENGKVALAKVQAAGSAGFDVVLMDIQMPEMDGYTAVRALRGRGYGRPVVALTAHAMSEDRGKCVACGCDDYLAKPVDRRLLVETVAKWAGRSSPARAEKAEAKAETDGAKTVGAETTEAEAGAAASEFAGDPEMLALVEEFVASLPQKAAAMREAFRGGGHEELRRLAHQLKGVAGGYGYPSLTERARVLEEAAAKEDSEAQAVALQAVAGLCDAVGRERTKAAGAKDAGT